MEEKDQSKFYAILADLTLRVNALENILIKKEIILKNEFQEELDNLNGTFQGLLHKAIAEAASED